MKMTVMMTKLTKFTYKFLSVLDPTLHLTYGMKEAEGTVELNSGFEYSVL